MTRRLIYLSHPQVQIDPAVEVTDWGLSAVGRARVEAAAAAGWPGAGVRILSSAERKARETAERLSRPAGLSVEIDAEMGEIDRSATGYVPAARHDALARQLFAHPEDSAEGWERAVDAQARVVAALHRALQMPGDLLIVGHGGVGSLLWCHLAGIAITPEADQPAGGGQVWLAEEEAGQVRPVHGWRALETCLGA